MESIEVPINKITKNVSSKQSVQYDAANSLKFIKNTENKTQAENFNINKFQWQMFLTTLAKQLAVTFIDNINNNSKYIRIRKRDKSNETLTCFRIRNYPGQTQIFDKPISHLTNLKLLSFDLQAHN